jgi:DNA-binding MarR family transcriptional regulator
MSKYDRFFLVQKIRKVNEWEKVNLPIYGTRAGYELFLQLAELPTHAQKPLKEIYLSMNCAESTTRLLLRNLEADGWITLPRLSMDERFKGFQLTDKFLSRIDEWLRIHGICPVGVDGAAS